GGCGASCGIVPRIAAARTTRASPSKASTRNARTEPAGRGTGEDQAEELSSAAGDGRGPAVRGSGDRHAEDLGRAPAARAVAGHRRHGRRWRDAWRSECHLLLVDRRLLPAGMLPWLHTAAPSPRPPSPEAHPAR